MYQIRKIALIDIEDVVTIHNNAFPDFFLTLLGDHFLKLYYSSVLKSKDGILLGCYNQNNDLLGFCAGTMISDKFNIKLIKSNLFSFLGIGVYLLFTNLGALKRLYLNLSKTNNSKEYSSDYAELLSIGVAKTTQGKGIGKLLLSELERVIQVHGGQRLSLTTDFLENTQAIKFYESMKYKIYYDFVTYPNRKMYRMIKSLNN